METRAYRSKIGRLPFAMRHELNERLRDGATGESVLTWLNASPEWAAIQLPCKTDINPQNLSDWRQSGYANWLVDQQKTGLLRQFAERANSLIAACGGDPTAVGARLLAAQILDRIDQADPDTTGELVKAVSALRSGEADAARLDIQRRQLDLKAEGLALDRAKFDAAQKRAAQADDAEQAIRDPTLTPEARDRKIREIFGLK